MPKVHGYNKSTRRQQSHLAELLTLEVSLRLTVFLSKMEAKCLQAVCTKSRYFNLETASGDILILI